MAHNENLDSLKSELLAVGVNDTAGLDLLRGVLAGSGDCIKILDLEGRLQFMSEGGKRVMEVENFDALKGCPWPDFWEGGGHGQAKEAVAAAKSGRSYRFQNAAQTARGTPRFWDVQVSPILGLDGNPTHLLSISRDITEERHAMEEQHAALERQKFLTAELTHRVKNTLATVMAIAMQTFRGDAHKEPREAFAGRIQTMSEAYNVLTDANWASTSIRLVVEAALAPFRTDARRITALGPDFEVTPAQALILALAINELATNAMKYGALSNHAGRVEVVWEITPASRLKFDWRESGGPEVIPPTRTGFGSRLIKTILPGDFGGFVEMRYDPAGVTCSLDAAWPVTPSKPI